MYSYGVVLVPHSIGADHIGEVVEFHVVAVDKKIILAYDD
jgi:hypothetical protein